MTLGVGRAGTGSARGGATAHPAPVRGLLGHGAGGGAAVVDYDPFAEWVRSDPQPVYKRLRDEAPAY